MQSKISEPVGQVLSYYQARSPEQLWIRSDWKRLIQKEIGEQALSERLVDDD